jgi:glutathione S-transferase
MKLYGNQHSACTKTVLLLLAERSAKLDFVPVNLSIGEHKTTGHLARHPFGRVPVLDDGEFVLYESRAILRYLDQVLPGTRLTPSDLRAQACMEQWISVDSCYFTPAAYTIVVQKLFVPAMGGHTDEQLVAQAWSSVRDVYRALEAQLAQTRYLVGDDFTLADLCFVQYTESLVAALGDSALDEFPLLARWRQRIHARPAFSLAQELAA